MPILHVDVHCKKCGGRKRLAVGDPGAKPVEEFVHYVAERLSHKPSFECFGGHLELRPPVPEFWEIDWSTLGNG